MFRLISDILFVLYLYVGQFLFFWQLFLVCFLHIIQHNGKYMHLSSAFHIQCNLYFLFQGQWIFIVFYD